MGSLENADTDNQEHMKVQGYRDGNWANIKDIGDLFKVPPDLERKLLALGIRNLAFTGLRGWKGDTIYGVFSRKEGELMKDEQFFCETLQLLRDAGINILFSDNSGREKGIYMLEKDDLDNFRNWLMTHKDLIKYLPILREFGIYVIRINKTRSEWSSQCRAWGGSLLLSDDSSESFIRTLAPFAYLLKQRPFVQISTKYPPLDFTICHLEKIVQWLKRHNAKLRQRFNSILIEGWLGCVQGIDDITADTLRIKLPNQSNYWDNLQGLDEAKDESWNIIFSDKKYNHHIVEKEKLLDNPQGCIDRFEVLIRRVLLPDREKKGPEKRYASSRQYIANEVVRMLFKSGTCKAVAKDESATRFAVRRADGSYSGYMVEVDVITPPFVVTFKEVKKDENGQWKTTVKFRKYFGEITEIYGKEGAK